MFVCFIFFTFILYGIIYSLGPDLDEQDIVVGIGEERTQVMMGHSFRRSLFVNSTHGDVKEIKRKFRNEASNVWG